MHTTDTIGVVGSVVDWLEGRGVLVWVWWWLWLYPGGRRERGGVKGLYGPLPQAIQLKNGGWGGENGGRAEGVCCIHGYFSEEGRVVDERGYVARDVSILLTYLSLKFFDG